MAVNTKNRRRYYLHQRIKNDFKYSAAKRTVFVKWDYDIRTPHLLELRDKFNYNIQTEIY